MEAVAERFIQAYFEDMARLNIKEADAYPRTHTLDGIKRLVYELEQKAYPAAGMFTTRCGSLQVYGKLSGRKLNLSRGEWAGSQPVRVPSAQRRLA